MALQRDGYINANMFHKRVIEESFEDNLFKVLLNEFDHNFFSHLHDIQLVLLPKEEVIHHFYDFFLFLCKHYNGEQIGASYRFYYVLSNHLERAFKEKHWRATTLLEDPVLILRAHGKVCRAASSALCPRKEQG